MTDFHERHALWVTAMRGDSVRPRNSIHSQIVELVDSAAWYRITIRARELAAQSEPPSPRLNGPFHCWIDTIFVDSFLVRVRRLTGSPRDALEGRDSCHSLMPLLRDLLDHRPLLTRSNLLSLDGLPFDLHAASRLLNEYLKIHSVGNDWSEIPAHLDVRRGTLRNDELDRLCEVTADNRALDDVISKTSLEGIQQRLVSATESLSLLTNKLIAHASTLESRQTDSRGDIEKTRITLGDFWAALECLCRTVGSLDGWLINRVSHDFLPDMHGHHWLGIDSPLVQPSDIPHLREYWDKLQDEARIWGAPAHTT